MQRKTIARIIQLISHPSYILLGILFFYGHQGHYYYYPGLMLFTSILFYICIKLSNKYFNFEENPLSLTPLIISGNIILNLEAYTFLTYCLVSLIAVISRTFIKTKKGHIYNPGYFGVFVIAMIAPKYGYPSSGLWQSSPYIVLLILLLGHIVTTFAKTIVYIYSYVFSFIILNLSFNFFCKLNHIDFNGILNIPYLFWPSTLLTTTSLIFIFHVISDPKTSPSKTSEQIIFGSMLGTLDCILRLNLIQPSELLAYIIVQTIHGIYKNDPRNN